MAEQSGSEPTVVVERRSGGGIGLFILGVAVGAGIALLLAPQSGAETRQDLRRGARRLRRKARGGGEGGGEDCSRPRTFIKMRRVHISIISLLDNIAHL